MLTELQKELGDLERGINYLQPDKLRWRFDRQELIDKLNYIKRLAREAENKPQVVKP